MEAWKKGKEKEKLPLLHTATWKCSKQISLDLWQLRKTKGGMQGAGKMHLSCSTSYQLRTFKQAALLFQLPCWCWPGLFKEKQWKKNTLIYINVYHIQNFPKMFTLIIMNWIKYYSIQFRLSCKSINQLRTNKRDFILFLSQGDGGGGTSRKRWDAACSIRYC